MSTAFYLLCPLSLRLTTPKPRAQVLGYKTPLFLAKLAACPLGALEGGSIQLTQGHWQCVHSLSALPSSCLEGESGLFEHPHRVDFVEKRSDVEDEAEGEIGGYC